MLKQEFPDSLRQQPVTLRLLLTLLISLTALALAELTPTILLAESDDAAIAKKILSISDNGLSSNEIEVPTSSGSLFVLNSTSDSLLTIIIEFGDKRGHCWSRNLEFTGGQLRSTAPFAPDEFSLMCFPQEGSYPFTVFGLNQRNNNPQTTTLQGVIHAKPAEKNSKQ